MPALRIPTIPPRVRALGPRSGRDKSARQRMCIDRDCRFERILDCVHVLRSYPAGQSPAVRLDQSPQGVGDFRTCLVASQDDFGNPGATHTIGIDANEWLAFLDSVRLVADPSGKGPREDRQTATAGDAQSFRRRLCQCALDRVIHGDRGYTRRQRGEELDIAGWTAQRRSGQPGDP